MRARNPNLLFISLTILALYLWTWTESAAITLRVYGDTCTAELYGRSSAIPCPGLRGGELVAFAGKTRAAPPLAHGPLNWLAPGSEWVNLVITAAEGNSIHESGPMPDSFTVEGRLLRPNEPAGLVLLPPGSDDGWAFVPDGQTRRGTWHVWENRELGPPVQGVPFDKPLYAQAQSLLRLFLDGWQGALLLLVAAVALSIILPDLATRISHGSFSISPRLIALPLILAVFAVTLHVAVDILQRIPHVQDSVTYLFQAQTLAGGSLFAPAPPLSDAAETPHFRQEFLLVRDGRWFGKYPPGYPAVLAIGVLTGAHWIVNPLLAALTLPLFYALARTIYPREPDAKGAISDVGLWSMILLAVSPFFLIMSGSLMAHAAELFWAVLFMIGWVRAQESKSVRWAILAGIAFGMLFLTRQFAAVLIGLSFGGGWLLLRLTQQKSRGFVSNPWRPAAPLIAAAAAMPFALAIFGYQAAVTGSPLTDPRLLYWPYDRVGFGPGFGESENVFTFLPSSAGLAQVWMADPAQPPRGNTPSLGFYNLGRNLSALQEDLFGWPPLLGLALIWLAFLARRPAAPDWVLLLVALAAGGGYIAYWAAGIAYGPRYFYVMLPALILLSARGITALASRTGPWPAVIIALILILASVVSLPRQLAAYRGYNFVDAGPRQVVEAAIDGPALVFISASDSDWWEYGAFFSGNTPWLNGRILYARDLGPAENARLGAAFPGRAIFLWRDGQLVPTTSEFTSEDDGPSGDTE